MNEYCNLYLNQIFSCEVSKYLSDYCLNAYAKNKMVYILMSVSDMHSTLGFCSFVFNYNIGRVVEDVSITLNSY